MKLFPSAYALFLGSLIAILFTGSAFAETYWVAAQNVGVPASFFTRNGERITASQIVVGDLLQSNRAINVRRRPADWKGTLFVLNSNASVRVDEKRQLLTAVGARQLWIRISTSAALVPSNDAEQEETAKNVTKCYKEGIAANKTMSIRDLHDCADVWVTPRTLLRCIVGAYCSALPDTLEGRSALDAALEQYNPKLTRDSSLALVAQLIPPLPSQKVIDECKKAGGTEDTFLACVGRGLDSGKYNAVVNCFGKPTERDSIVCFAGLVNNANFNVLIGCMSGGAPSTSKLLECTPGKNFREAAKKAQECIGSAASAQFAAECIGATLPADKKEFANCVSGKTKASAVFECIDKVSPDAARSRAALECLSNDRAKAINCASVALPAEAGVFAKCITDANTAGARADCASAANPHIKKAFDFEACLKRGNPAFTCATQYLDSNANAFILCMLPGGNDRLNHCLSSHYPGVASAQKTYSCISNSTDATSAFVCLAPTLGGDAPRIAGCIGKTDKATAALCLLGDKPEARAVQRAYKCLSEGNSASDLLANCTEGIVDPKTSQTASCVVKAGGDRAKLASCAATAALPPDMARLAGCSASSEGATAFALCVAGPAMNEEWRIAAECATQSGGEPMTFAGCTAGRLTLRELTKCFTGQDCFGPNNTIVRAFNDALHDLTHGWGDNNDVKVFLGKLGELAGGENSVIRNPAQLAGGPNSMVNRPSQIWGGENSVFNQALGGENSEARKIFRTLDVTTWRF